jgi:hypothetical protein
MSEKRRLMERNREIATSFLREECEIEYYETFVSPAIVYPTFSFRQPSLKALAEVSRSRS